MAKVMAPIFTLWNYFQECAFGNVNTQKRLKFLILFPNFFVLISGSLESPLSASPIQSYHQSSTYFYQNCQWFFDPPPARELQMKISTTQTMGMFIQSISISWWLTPFYYPHKIDSNTIFVIFAYCSGLSDLECKHSNMEHQLTKSDGNLDWPFLSRHKGKRI